MSLLKKHGKANKKNQQEFSNIDPPPSPSALLSRRKSASIEPGDVERPHSQQSVRSSGGGGGGGGVGAGGKKKIIPSFLSNLFGNNNKISESETPEVVADTSTTQTTPTAATAETKLRSTSHESINSVLSSSSFSYVKDPTAGEKKKVKGKRIPVDDPSYGSTRNNNNSDKGNKKEGGDGEAGKSKIVGGISGTLGRIGMRIGLKSKYNLQSCESLQYIDACDDPLPPPPPPPQPSTSSSSSSPKIPLTKPPGENETPTPAPSPGPSTSVSVLVKVTNKSAIGSSTPSTHSTAPTATAAPLSKDVLKQENPVVKKESKSFSESSAQTQVENVVVIVEKQLPVPTTSSAAQTKKVEDVVVAKQSLLPATTSSVKTNVEDVAVGKQVPVPTTSSALTKNVEDVVFTKQVPAPTYSFAQTKKVEDAVVAKQVILPTTSFAQTKKIENVVVAKQLPVPTNSFAQTKKVEDVVVAKQLPFAQTKKVEDVVVTKQVPVPTRPTPSSESSNEPLHSRPPPPSEEPQPSTSSSAFKKLQIPPPPPKVTESLIAASNSSNTWSNSGRRKRRAPPPPTLVSQTSIVTDIPNDVPTSSSQAALLRKFTRIEESPPPSTRKPSLTPFEIRPRKRERSLEPPPPVVVRPTSSSSPLADAVSNNGTLFSTRRHRYQHKRSCSEGQEQEVASVSGGGNTSNTNTRGRVHKVGKKKAPAPPNPFGDPEVLEVPEEAVPVLAQSLPPTNPPKSRPEAVIVPALDVTINPFETPSPPQTPTTTIMSVSSSTPPQNDPVPPQVEVEPPAPPPPVETVNMDTSLLDDLLEEIRQNMLNDQQERLIHQQQTNLHPEMEPEVVSGSVAVESESSSTRAPERPVSIVSAQSTSAAASSTITETDVLSAQRSLQVLSTATSTPATNRAPEVDPSTKAKLAELKKEAEKSPLNLLKVNSKTGNGSRPTSSSSSNYESPLAILLGRGSQSSTNDSTSGGESSPKVAQKQPWYKRGASSALPRQLLPSKFNKHSTSVTTSHVKPFTSLVKFSELDREAAQIVEENRRRSAEQRSLENEQQLLELFSDDHAGLLEELQTAAAVAAAAESHIPSTIPQRATEPLQPNRILTTAAQVHQEQTPPPLPTSPPPGEDEVPSTRTSGSSSPTFQSMHAASKHARKIKPLLTSSSPISHVRSEKLAIVQPQTSATLTTRLSTATPVPPTTTTSASTVFTEWDCPRCTLKNPSWRILCEICFQRRDTGGISASGTGSYISSILQRVNSESSGNKANRLSWNANNNNSSTTVTTSTTSMTSGTTTATTATPASSTAVTTTTAVTSTPRLINTAATTTSIQHQCIPSVVEDFQQSTSSTSSSSSNPLPPVKSSSSSRNKDNTNKKSCDIPEASCENLLSQLPVNNDNLLANKAEKLQEGINKLHNHAHDYHAHQHEDREEGGDPEVEELDIGKLRRARLAYFQKDNDNKNPCDSAGMEKPLNIPIPKTRNSQKNSGGTNELSKQIPSNSSSSAATFSDDEDGFIDNMLQLSSAGEESPPQQFPAPQKPTASIITSNSDSSPVAAATVQIQNVTRYKPRLEAIREGNSQDYAYCYSSSEIAQIYENWQRSENTTTSLQSLVQTQPTIISSGIRTSSNSGPLLPSSVLLAPSSSSSPSSSLVDRQPYANNRLCQDVDANVGSPEQGEENYMNVNVNLVTSQNIIGETAGDEGIFTPTPTPPIMLLRSSCNGNNVFERQQNFLGESTFINGNNLNHNINNNNGENSYQNQNNMSGARDSRHHHHPQLPPFLGFAGGMIMRGNPNLEDCWTSSESSSDSGSRGGLLSYLGRGGISGAYLGLGGGGVAESSPGMTRRGTLDSAAHSSSSPAPSMALDQSQAVGKLMKRLEAAIASGDHRLAATLAHDMALMKVSCVVAKINQPFSIRVYVEDRFMQQGPFLVQVSSMMSVGDLKGKIQKDWGIPAGFQKWILGRQMAEDDGQSLSSFEISQDSMAFLFLVTPEMGKSVDNNLISSPGTSSSNNLVSVGTSGRQNSSTPSPQSQQPLHNMYNNIPSGPSTPKKKSSSVTQTPMSSLVTRSPSPQKRGANSKENSPAPPPIPSKSPIPHFSNNNTSNQTPIGAAASASIPSTSKIISKPPGGGGFHTTPQKNQQQQQTISTDTISAASALTLSLQQKLSEFKAVTEQTFGKGPVGLPPTAKYDVPTKPPRREASPAPNSATSRKSLNDGGATKPPARKIPPVKGQYGQRSTSNSKNNSREKLANNSNEGSHEKLPEISKKEAVNVSAIVPENRFNGILLPTSKDEESVKPPERMDKGWKRDVAESPTTSSPSPVNLESPVAAPQPKPRGIKKQSTVEKVSQGTESPTIVVPATAISTSPLPSEEIILSAVIGPPKPLPRTLTLATSPTPPPLKIQEEELPQKEEEAGKKPENGLKVTEILEENPILAVDDFCQTTLPFPAAKPSPTASTSGGCIPGKGNVFSIMSGNTSQNENVAGNQHNMLLRPSAFVTQLNKPISSEATITPTTTSGPPPTFTGNGIAIAHVQPLNVTPPTAYVSPSPSSSYSAQLPPLPPTHNKKEEDDDNQKQDYLKMVEMMEKQDLISCSEVAECPVCFSSVSSGEGVMLRDCLHVFCRECLVGCVQYADDSTVKCPFRDNNYTCNSNLQEREIKALVPVEIFEKYLARSVKLAESKIVNTFHCKTPDCTGWCVFEDDVNVFLCPVCKKRNCLTCAAIHEGIDCQKYQRELAIAAETDEDAKQSRLMLEKMIQRGEALDCPACHVVLLKKWGCDWVRCSYCKTEICWVTKGHRWGPGGKGDTSGGCKCGINGVKCHPKCTYCH